MTVIFKVTSGKTLQSGNSPKKLVDLKAFLRIKILLNKHTTWLHCG